MFLRYMPGTEGTTGHDLILGTAVADHVHGGTGVDVMFGGAGADVFHFSRGDSAGSPAMGGYGDVILDFRSGVDKLDIDVSQREVSWMAVDGGVRVDYGGLAGQGADAGHVFLSGVTALTASDFVW